MRNIKFDIENFLNNIKSHDKDGTKGAKYENTVDSIYVPLNGAIWYGYFLPAKRELRLNLNGYNV